MVRVLSNGQDVIFPRKLIIYWIRELQEEVKLHLIICSLMLIFTDIYHVK